MDDRLFPKQSLLGEFSSFDKPICSQSYIHHVIFVPLLVSSLRRFVCASGGTLSCSRLLVYNIAGLLSIIVLGAIELERVI